MSVVKANEFNARSGGFSLRKFMIVLPLALGTLIFDIEVKGQMYQSAQLDNMGQLTITLDSGTAIHPAKLPDQVTFSQPMLSLDHRVVAWIANYPDPSATQGSAETLPGRLVLYRSGHVLRSFSSDQVFWSWQFAHRGKDVAFCTGPMHGGAAVCELHQVSSGRLMSRWHPKSNDRPPPWVNGLSF